MLFNQTRVNTDLQTESYAQADKTERKLINLNILFMQRLVEVQKAQGHFQDKTQKFVNSRTKINSKTFPRFPGLPGRVDTLKKRKTTTTQ